MQAKKQINLSERTDLSEKIEPPENYKVVLFNDDITPMDFVVFILISIFNKSEIDAENLMLKIHKTGSSLIDIYVYDIAITKASQVAAISEKNNFPLKCKVEKVWK